MAYRALEKGYNRPRKPQSGFEIGSRLLFSYAEGMNQIRLNINNHGNKYNLGIIRSIML